MESSTVLKLMVLVVIVNFTYGSSNSFKKYVAQKIDKFKVKLNHDLNLKKLNKAGISQDTPFRTAVTSWTSANFFGKKFAESATVISTCSSDDITYIYIAFKNKHGIYTYQQNSGDNYFQHYQDLPDLQFKIYDAIIAYRNNSLFLAILLKSSWKYTIKIYEVSNTSIHHHHDIGFYNYKISGLKFGQANSGLFLVIIFNQNVFQKTSFTHFEVYHWGVYHFNPVVGNYYQRVTTNGAKDLQVWEHHGSLKIAILDNDHLDTKGSKVLVLNLHVSYDAFHSSQFDIRQEEIIQLPFIGTRMTYFKDVSQHLAICSADRNSAAFYVYTILPRSEYFIFNDLLSPNVDGRADFIWHVPVPYPDLTILTYDPRYQIISIYRQDLNLRFAVSKKHYLTDMMDMDLVPISSKNGQHTILQIANQNPSLNFELTVFEYRPLYRKKDVLIECLDDVSKLAKQRETNITWLRKSASKIFVNNKDQNVTTDVVVEGLNVTRTLAAESLVLATNESHVSEVTNTKLLKHIMETAHEVSKSSKESLKVVFKSSEQTITGNLTFSKGLYIVNGAIDYIVNDAIINYQKISRYHLDTLKVRGDQVIENGITISDLKIRHNLKINYHLNGENIEDLVSTNASQVLSGNFTFAMETKFIDLHVNIINNVSLEYLVLTTGNQAISGLKSFDKVNVMNIAVIGATNGVDLSEYASTLVTLDGNHVLSGHCKFNHIHVFGNIDLEGLISNQINITQFAHSVVTLDSDQIIFGLVTFKSNIQIDGYMRAAHINTIRTNKLINLSKNQTISGLVHFAEGIHCMQSINTKYINRISPEHWVRRSEAFNISAHKTFKNSMHVDGNISMDDYITIDSVDPSQLNLNILPKGGHLEVFGETSSHTLHVTGDIIFNATVNGYNISEIDDVFWRKSVFQVIPVDVVAPSHVKFKRNLSTDSGVNNHDFQDHYVHAKRNETISSHVNFKDTVVVDGDVKIMENQTINGFDISVLSKYAVIKNGASQQLFGVVYFGDLTVDGDVFVNSTVNGFDVSEDFMDVYNDQIILTPVKFENTTTFVDNVEADTIELPENGAINHIDISKLEQELVLINRNSQRTISGKIFRHLIVDNLNVRGSINCINVNYCLQNVVTLSTFQKVGGRKQFIGHMEFRQGVDLRYLNGFDFKNYVKTIINRTVDTVVKGKKSIHGKMNVFGNVVMEPLKEINHIDVSEMSNNTMVRNKLQYVTGFIWFNSSQVLIDKLTMHNSTLDGVNLDKIALTTKDTILEGSIKFSNHLVINDSLTVYGTVHQCDLYNLYANSIKLHGKNSQVISQCNIFGDLIVKHLGDVIVKHNKTINEIDISKFAKSVLQNNGKQNITGNIIFEATVSIRDLYIDIINERNITAILDDLVLKNISNQMIKGRKTFKNDVRFKKIKVSETIEVDEDINGVDIEKLANSTVFKSSNTTIRGKKRFWNIIFEDVLFKGLLNGVNTSDFCLIHTTEYLSGYTTFAANSMNDSTLLDIIVEDLKVGGLIDGQNISQVINDRVTLSSNDLVKTHLIFTDDVIVHGDCLVIKTLNGIDPVDIVSINKSHDIYGFKHFKETVVVKGDVTSGLINGINITGLSSTVVRNDGNHTIWSKTSFENIIHFGNDVRLNGTMDHVDLYGSAKNFTELQKEIYLDIDKMLGLQWLQKNDTDHVIENIQGQTVVPSHFKKVSSKYSKIVQFHKPDLHQSDELLAFVEGEGCFPGCSCVTSCYYNVHGPDLHQTRCTDRKSFKVCHEGECYTLSSSKLTGSETCQSDILDGLFEYADIVHALAIPTITDAIVLPSLYFIAATPFDGMYQHSANVFRLLDGAVVEEPSLHDSMGVKYLEIISPGTATSKVYFVGVGRDFIHLYTFNVMSGEFYLDDKKCTKCNPTGVVALRSLYMFVVGCAVEDSGHLSQENGPNLLVYQLREVTVELVDEVYTGSVDHLSHLKYAGDDYIITSQSDEDKVVLYQVQGQKLKPALHPIPALHPSGVIPTHQLSTKLRNSTNTTSIPSYIENDIYLHILSPNKLSVVQAVQFGNGINIKNALP